MELSDQYVDTSETNGTLYVNYTSILKNGQIKSLSALFSNATDRILVL